MPLVTVFVAGYGYDYADASEAYLDLPNALERAEVGRSQALQAMLPPDVTVAALGERLHSILTAIIALAWTPSASKNQMAAVLDDILSRREPNRKAKALKRTLSAERRANKVGDAPPPGAQWRRMGGAGMRNMVAVAKKIEAGKRPGCAAGPAAVPAAAAMAASVMQVSAVVEP